MKIYNKQLKKIIVFKKLIKDILISKQQISEGNYYTCYFDNDIMYKKCNITNNIQKVNF